MADLKRLLKPGALVAGSKDKIWLVVRGIGCGTCCQVYCVELVNSTAVKGALKVYKKGANFEGAHDREALLLELVYETSETANNHIVRVLDNFVYEGRSCLVENLCGHSLRQIIQMSLKDKGLPSYTIIKMLHDLLSGLHALHSSGFVHGDIKPTNLLWCAQDGCLKLIDFGLSFHYQDKVIGKIQSRGYEAPEVQRRWKSHRHHSHRHTDPMTSASTSNEEKKNSHTEELNSVDDNELHSNYKLSADTRKIGEDILDSTNYSLKRKHETILNEVGCKKTDKMADGAEYSTAVPDKETLVTVGKAADMWSVGCVLMEMIIGEKLPELNNHVTDEVSNNLIKTKIGNVAHIFTSIKSDLTDLLSKLFVSDTEHRFTAEQALTHIVFKQVTEPKFIELVLLPTRIIRVLNVLDENETNDEELYKDVFHDMREECCKHGVVKSCVIPKHGPAAGKVFLEFVHSEHAAQAYDSLRKREYRDRTILVTYFPQEDWICQKLF